MSKPEKLKSAIFILWAILSLALIVFIGYSLYSFFSSSQPDFDYRGLGNISRHSPVDDVNIATTSSNVASSTGNVYIKKTGQTTSSPGLVQLPVYPKLPCPNGKCVQEIVASSTVPVEELSPEIDVAPASLTPQNFTLCGNGVIDRGEECDGDNLNGSDCSARGFSGGNLRCSGNCHFDLSECSNMCSASYCANQYGANTSYNVCYQDKCCKKIKVMLWDYYACK